MVVDDLSAAYDVVMSNHLGGYASFYQAVKEFFFPESPIEAITDFRKICLQVFFRDPTVRTSNHGFSIGNEAMKPWEKFPCSFMMSKDNFIN